MTHVSNVPWIIDIQTKTIKKNCLLLPTILDFLQGAYKERAPRCSEQSIVSEKKVLRAHNLFFYRKEHTRHFEYSKIIWLETGVVPFSRDTNGQKCFLAPNGGAPPAVDARFDSEVCSAHFFSWYYSHLGRSRDLSSSPRKLIFIFRKEKKSHGFGVQKKKSCLISDWFWVKEPHRSKNIFAEKITHRKF